MSRYEQLTIKEVVRETPDAVSLVLDVPNELQETYSFLPGQYVTLRTEIDGQDIRRSYSICSAPYEGILKVGVKKVPNGLFSTLANDRLKAGDTLQVMHPIGKFVLHANPSHAKTYVCFCAGSGITPILSMMKTVLHEEPQSRFILFYGSRQKGSIIYRNEIDGLKNLHHERLSVHHVMSGEDLGTELFCGRIDKARVQRFATLLFDPTEVDDYYLCGPEPMIHAVREVLEERGVAKERVHFELFTSAAKLEADRSAEDTAHVAPARPAGPAIKSRVTVVMDGDEFDFELASNGKTILDAAMGAGLDVPFSCKGAVCCTCLARVKSGVVTMDKNYSLTDKEVEQGLVLTCQSHPQTPEVTVDYDDIW
ncbi:MAG: 2Fe-2S iron-sulfur cluster binding domain-containing protein [Flavobacteriales bacterium]|nr:2Fe-2S iron-sulfur cluster binding domain-containing protein [Flavobacteriales bacterium]